MKKMSVLYVFAVIAVLLVAVPANAQLRLGAIGGLNMANVSIDPDMGFDTSNLTGVAIGGVLDLSLGEVLSLQLEPMYLKQGSKLSFEGDEADLEANYIQVPVMFKYAFGENDTKPYVLAGPEIGFRLGDAEFKGSDIENEKLKTKSFNFGVGFGGGVSFAVGNNTAFVQGRYSLGLMDVNDEPNDDTKIKTRSIQILAGITFPLGGDSYTYKGR